MSLNISGSFELIEAPGVYKPVSWSTVPRDDIIVKDTDDSESVSTDEENTDPETASLEIRKPLDLLGDDLQLVITPSNQKLDVKQIYIQITENVVPIFIYVIDQDRLSDHDVEELRIFRSIVQNDPILFIRIEP